MTTPTLHDLLNKPLTTEAEAEQWVRDMTAIGYGAHPDDRAADIVDYRTGEPAFTAEEAVLHDQRMDEVFDLLDDPYAVSLDAFGAGLGG